MWIGKQDLEIVCEVTSTGYIKKDETKNEIKKDGDCCFEVLWTLPQFSKENYSRFCALVFLNQC